MRYINFVLFCFNFSPSIFFGQDPSLLRPQSHPLLPPQPAPKETPTRRKRSLNIMWCPIMKWSLIWGKVDYRSPNPDNRATRTRTRKKTGPRITYWTLKTWWKTWCVCWQVIDAYNPLIRVKLFRRIKQYHFVWLILLCRRLYKHLVN